MNKVIKLFWIAALSLLCTSCSAMLADLGLADDPSSSAASVDGDCDPDVSDECDEDAEGGPRKFARGGSDEEEGLDDGFNRVPEGGRSRNRVLAAIDSNDVVPGMTRSEVLQSWGEPHVREFAGNGESGHERWTYGSRRSMRGETYLLFEDGRVVGWQRR